MSNSTETIQNAFVINKDNLFEVGHTLREVRLSVDPVPTQTDVAERTGKLQSHISKIETVGANMPTLVTVVEYLDAIGFEIVLKPKNMDVEFVAKKSKPSRRK